MVLSRSSLVLALTMTLMSGPARAQTTEYLEISPNAPHNYQRFGSAAAVQGPWAVFGADWDPAGGVAAGAVYVFDLTTGQQLHKLMSTDIAAGDRFGTSVAISGNTLIIGAPGSNTFGPKSGAAYIFDLETGQQLAKLIPNQGFQEAYFGFSVGIDGGMAIIGAPLESPSNSENGAVYLFDPLSGQQLARLVASDIHDYDNFGTSVAIQGDMILVGSPGADLPPANVGAVYVFDTSTGNELRKMTPAQKIYSQRFGTKLAVSGSVAIVGAPDTDDGLCYKCGSAYLFDFTSGQELARLVPDYGNGNFQYFGSSVGISGRRAIVGAERALIGAERPGLVFMYDAFTGQKVNSFLASDQEDDDLFGGSVGIHGLVTIVGAPGKNTSAVHSGSAYVFYPVVSWEQSPINGHWYMGTNFDLTWSMAEVEARSFGGHLATIRSQAENDWLMGNHELNDRSRWIGYTDVAFEGQFEWINGEPPGFENWYPGEPDDVGGADWTAWDPATGMWFDEPQAPGRPSIVEVISPDCDGDGVPDAYQMAREPGLDWDGNGVLDACSPPNFCTALINSTGLPAGIGAEGSPVLAEDSVTLTAWNLPLNETGYFMAGESQGYLRHFGGSAGILCLGAPIYRFSSPASGGAVLDSGDTGTVELTLDLGLLPQGITFDPGETWYFQLWYRDVDSGGPTSNTSDGLTVLFR